MFDSPEQGNMCLCKCTCVYVCVPLYLCHKIRLIIKTLQGINHTWPGSHLLTGFTGNSLGRWSQVRGCRVSRQTDELQSCWPVEDVFLSVVGRLDQHISTAGSLIASISFTGHKVIQAASSKQQRTGLVFAPARVFACHLLRCVVDLGLQLVISILFFEYSVDYFSYLS